MGLPGEAHRATDTVGQILHKGADGAGKKILPLIYVVKRCLFEQLFRVEPCSGCWGHNNEQNRESLVPWSGQHTGKAEHLAKRRVMASAGWRIWNP